MSSTAPSPASRWWQRIAIVCLVCFLAMPVHKGYHDVSRLAEQHSGTNFLFALLKYFIGNLAGGGKTPG